MPINPYPTVTVGQLIEWLKIYPDHYTVDFGGLDFDRFKQRAPTHLQAVFAQTVYLDASGRVAVDNHN